jgi:acyl-coenzyme A synthetase/AMP-(fatty) acid ligase
LVLLSGDWIPVSLPDRIRSIFGDIEVVSLGGATEASIWSIYHRIGRTNASWNSIPYGSPLSGQAIHVLDDNLDPTVDESPGELYIAGAGLARGYWSDPAKTAAAFVPDPINGQRMYRTGDFGRKMKNGEIEFLGRKDQQIKIRGYRIELGEVESTLETHPGVQRAVAFKHVYSPSDQRLLACIVARPGWHVNESLLHEFISERLPNYMLPAAFIFLDIIPVTGNGKVDRQAMSLMVTVDHRDLDLLLDDVEQVAEADVLAQLHSSGSTEAQHE